MSFPSRLPLQLHLSSGQADENQCPLAGAASNQKNPQHDTPGLLVLVFEKIVPLGGIIRLNHVVGWGCFRWCLFSGSWKGKFANEVLDAIRPLRLEACNSADIAQNFVAFPGLGGECVQILFLEEVRKSLRSVLASASWTERGDESFCGYPGIDNRRHVPVTAPAGAK